MMKTASLTVISLLIFTLSVWSQEFKSAHEYMGYIGAESKAVSEQMLSYISAAAHSKRIKKSEKERAELIDRIKTAKDKVSRMPAYEGDKTYRDGVAEYLELNYHVMKEDYEKILDMEDIAEQSFDLMEAYLTAQQEANKKVNEAADKLLETQKAFGAKYDIQIIDQESEVNLKLAEANKVIKYYNQVYLIFFKSYKQELYTLEAIKATDMKALEQNRNALLQYTEEGLKQLNNMPAFKGDTKLKYACRQALNFYKKEAEGHFAATADFYVKKENFEKTKAAFEALKSKERTQESVDKYNKAVSEFNEAVKKANSGNENLNEKRAEIINNWNKTVSEFMAKHIPRK